MKLMLIKSLLAVLAMGGLITAVHGADVFGETASSWPGVKFGVSKVQRIGEDLVLIAIRISADATAPTKTLIGAPPVEKYSPSREVDARNIQDYLPGPFALTEAYIVDEASKQKYPAQLELPPQPFWGPNSICTNLEKGGWLQLAVLFKAPPEVVEASAGQPKINVYLPKSVGPIRNIEIPRLAAVQP